MVMLGLAGVGHADGLRSEPSPRLREVLEWNQIFIDTLIATNTANSSSQRLGAIVHTAIFDAYNGIERRYTPIFVHEQGPARRVAPGGGHRGGVHRAGRPVPVPAGGARCPLCGVAGGAERRCERRHRRTTALVRDAHRARHRLGNRGRAGRARLARDRWVQRELPAVHRWDRGRPVAADTAGLRADERAGLGIHRDVRPAPATPSSGLDRRAAWTARRTRTISTPSRRSVARPDRRAPTTRRRSRRSGRATPASTGIRPRTRSRAPTTCPCPRATGCSRS